MKTKIEISSYGEGYFSGLVREIEISLNEIKQDYHSKNIDINFQYPLTVLYSGFTDSLIIAISGGMAAHLLNRLIDEIIKVLEKRVRKEKKDKEKSKTQTDKIGITINHIVIERAKNINIKIKDIDLDKEFELPTEKNKCLEHFDKKIKK